MVKYSKKCDGFHQQTIWVSRPKRSAVIIHVIYAICKDKKGMGLSYWNFDILIYFVFVGVDKDAFDAEGAWEHW